MSVVVATRGSARGTTVLAGLVGLTGLSAAVLAWQTVAPTPVEFAGMTIDRLGAALTLLVSAVGAATYRFSTRYLDGEPIQARFLRRLAITIGSAYVLMIATDIRLLIAAWAVVSLGLHGLLTTYPDRAEAWRPARKKFLISRLGDVALIAAAVLIRSGWGTYDIHAFVRAVAAGPITPSVSAVALLIVAAALTKSAQFPFHSWLPETMEAPTPVSALMHAGIINAGGALLIRFAPAIVRVPESLLLLSVVGTITAALGTVAMWAQVKVKRTLAWSTVAQMGFMTVQCGLGAFPAALLHILGHGSYKAWSFLRSGGLPAPAPRVRPNTPAITLLLTAIGAVVGASSMTYASRLTGFHPDHSPGELALAAVVALSIGQAWAALIGQARAAIRSTLARFAAAIAVSVVGPVALFALYRAAGAFLGDLTAPTGPIAWISATIPVMGFAGLTIVHTFLPSISRTATGRAFHVHALHGFYFGAIADRAVDRISGHIFTKGVRHA